MSHENSPLTKMVAGLNVSVTHTNETFVVFPSVGDTFKVYRDTHLCLKGYVHNKYVLTFFIGDKGADVTGTEPFTTTSLDFERSVPEDFG